MACHTRVMRLSLPLPFAYTAPALSSTALLRAIRICQAENFAVPGSRVEVLCRDDPLCSRTGGWRRPFRSVCVCINSRFCLRDYAPLTHTTFVTNGLPKSGLR